MLLKYSLNEQNTSMECHKQQCKSISLCWVTMVKYQNKAPNSQVVFSMNWNLFWFHLGTSGYTCTLIVISSSVAVIWNLFSQNNVQHSKCLIWKCKKKYNMRIYRSLTATWFFYEYTQRKCLNKTWRKITVKVNFPLVKLSILLLNSLQWHLPLK